MGKKTLVTKTFESWDKKDLDDSFNNYCLKNKIKKKQVVEVSSVSVHMYKEDGNKVWRTKYIKSISYFSRKVD